MRKDYLTTTNSDNVDYPLYRGLSNGTLVIISGKQKKTTKARKTWVGFKPRKEATKKERLEKARKKYKGEQEQ